MSQWTLKQVQGDGKRGWAIRLSPLVALPALAGCLSHPPPPPAPYHAYGKDSAWNLIIDDKNVTFIPAGGQPIVQPKPQPIIGIAGDIYQAGRINVNIVHGSCAIGDRNFADRVQVRIEGDMAYEGCGGDFTYGSAPGSDLKLENTRWHVALVNGRPTPAVGDYSMSFTDGQVGARTGCNSMGGRYSIAGRTLTVTDLASTLMGCPEPAATFEQQASAVLMRPMQVEVAAGGRLVLSNAAGSISLTPVA